MVIAADGDVALDLHRLVQERYDTTSPEGYDLLLWGDLKILFEPNEEDEIWKNQQDYNLISWRLFDSCGIHMLLMHTGIAIHMMIEKKYPLTQEMLSRMLSRRLEVDQESEMAFELLRFARSSWDQQVSNTTAKLPILKLGEYEMWVIRIKQYFQVQDYALWELIENGNSWVSVQRTAQENGTFVTKMSVPVTAEEKTNKKNDVKARSLLLMALPNEHQLTFSQYIDAKTMFAAIETRFGESLDSIINRLQKIVSRLAILGVVITQEDLNSKFLRSLPLEWNTHVVVWMNKADIETMSIDDLFKNFKIVKQDVKKSVGASSAAQNLAFMTASSTSSTNDVNTANPAYEVSTVSPNINTACPQVSTANFSDNTVNGFEVAALSAKYEGKKGTFPGNVEHQGTNRSDMEEEQVQTNMALMAFSDSELNQTKFTAANKRGLATVEEQLITYRKNEVLFSKEVAVLKREVACKDYEINVLKSEFEKVKQEKEGIEFKIEKFDKSQEPRQVDRNDSKENSDDSLVKEQVSEDTSSFVESSLNVEKETVFLDKKIEFVKPKNHEKPVKKSVRVNYNYTTNRTHPNAQRNMVPRAVLMKTGLKPFNTARTVNTAHPKSTVFSAKPMSHFSKLAQSTVKRPYQSKTVLTNKKFTQTNNTAKAKAVNTARSHSTVVNAVRGKPQQDDTGFIDSRCSRHMTGNIAYLSNFKEFDGGYVTFGGGAHGGRILHLRMKPSEIRKNFIKEIENLGDKKVKIIRSDNGTKFKNKVMDDFYREKGIKREYSVARTPQQNGCGFERRIGHLIDRLARTMYIYRERRNQSRLHCDANWNDMCDKKNYVLFTDTECLVLSPNFKLPDESQILLKIPRKDNMYSFDMKNIVPKESLTCLVAKATLDESMLWHRRLGHINFKNINKLVKDNLVRGLPTKRFENDQTCVACLKGKQHRASCKSKVLNPITKPLFMLHMDLFGPTFVSSLMHKKYCLVVTDDYSRFTWVFFLASKDETSEILKNFIKEIENLVDKKVKIIRCDNKTEFKNKVIDDFCIEKADSKLPTTFLVEAVSTACYVQNMVLVAKPHNKTPYELFRGFKPALSFMRPFGCHVTILNTLDNLGKFDGKSDEGFLVGYSLSSKAFRVYNTRTRRVEENLHIGFLENKPMIEGNGPKWLFDIDSLTQSMNYVPVAAGTSGAFFEVLSKSDCAAKIIGYGCVIYGSLVALDVIEVLWAGS
ncbi:putative ribonuclease H-like domain-containing protein [Tanacetum coccineum]